MDATVQELWGAVASTAAFSEPQEVANCQHFVREALEALERRGLIRVPPSLGPLTLRNQWLAEQLRSWGHLEESLKPPPGRAGGAAVLGALTCGGAKVDLARLLCPWISRFALVPAPMAGPVLLHFFRLILTS
ncbi:unnamed protein product [Prorocentrum cordatum]|uniref:Uncharacterized protein n=1 Tax=Prorocentrum cordatum TaxID=2364126 RepID=A0ABN9RIX1_9DINO|nr:unnamed protein product [Polarella glacialis]